MAGNTMGGRFRSFERLGYSKRYFLSEMFALSRCNLLATGQWDLEARPG
jgi:hypothetical protein